MPVIRISDSTWSRLKKWAEPLEDTAEDVIRKVLDVAETSLSGLQNQQSENVLNTRINTLPTHYRKSKGRLDIGTRTQMDEYRMPVLESLSEMRGVGRVPDVLTRVGKKMKNTLREVDYQKISTGQVRWENVAQWERKILVDEGLIEPTSSSGRGIWKLTPAGYATIRGRNV